MINDEKLTFLEELNKVYGCVVTRADHMVPKNGYFSKKLFCRKAYY